MRVLGLAIKKGEMRYSIIEGISQIECEIIEDNKFKFNPDLSIPNLMNIFESFFIELIGKYSPDRIAYKLSLNLDLKQVIYMAFPYGILNLISYRKGITLTQRSSSWISAAKGKRLCSCKARFSDYKATLNDIQLDALLVAWYELE